MINLFTPNVKFELLHPEAKLPTLGTSRSGGFDLYVPGHFLLQGVQKIPLGIRSEFNPGWCGLIWDRSSLALKGVHCFAGVIDSDYRGEWAVVLFNQGAPLKIDKGTRVAQVIFQRCWTGKLRLGRVNVNTDRKGGFGSTNIEG